LNVGFVQVPDPPNRTIFYSEIGAAAKKISLVLYAIVTDVQSRMRSEPTRA
jgi:hypothetical protein